MDINKRDAINILSKNFGYPVVETALGNAVKLNAKDAFLFANITGAGYFDNPTYLFSPKGTQKTLREAFQFNLVTGIFDREKLYYSPAELQKCRPYLFSGDKYIVFEELTDECAFLEELQDKYDSLIKQTINPTDFIIARVEASKNGNGMEPFLEYLACEYFKRKGYIVENQVPLVATVGSPDFGGYKLATGRIGFHINELSLIRIFNNYEIADDLTCSSIIVGEAKTATTIMEKQLKKYLNTGLYEKGYELHPSKPEPSIQNFGLLNIETQYRIKVSEPAFAYVPPAESSYSLTEYKHWISQYLKYFLIANFTQEEFASWIRAKIHKSKYNVADVISFVNDLTTEQIIEHIQEVQ